MTTAEPGRDVADAHLQRWSEAFPDPSSRRAMVEAALVRMNVALQRSRAALREQLSNAEVSYEEFMTLHTLVARCGASATPAQLAERTGVTRAGMTSRLDRLAEKSLIQRQPDADDRRSVVVTPTEAGRAMWSRHLDAWEREEQELFDDLTDAELRRLNDLLRKMSPPAS